MRHDRELHHRKQRSKKKNKNTEKKNPHTKDFSFLQLDSYIYYHFYSGLKCAPCLHVFVKRTGSKLSVIDFIEIVNALLVIFFFFCKVCCVLVVEMLLLFILFPFVLLSARTNHFIIIEILISCFFYVPEKYLWP